MKEGIRTMIAKKSHYIVARVSPGWALHIFRQGRQPKTIYAATEAEANRARLKLSQDGLVGFIEGAGL